MSIMRECDTACLPAELLASDTPAFDPAFRPDSLNSFIGQQKLRENLNIAITAALARKEALEHVLFAGPPGLGKTTLSQIIAREMGVSIRVTSGPALERAGDLAAILTSLADGDVFFIDEIHRLPRIVEETLYPAMEDYTIDIVIGEGPNARTMKLAVPHFTLVGATTRSGMLSAPLRDRFGLQYRLQHYCPEELSQIVRRTASLMGMDLPDSAAIAIGSRSRGTPRIANRILRRVRDFAQVAGGPVTESVLATAFKALGIDDLGLDEQDRAILLLLIERFHGGPAGLDTVASALREDRETLEDVYEPYLLHQGLLERTARGRIATALAYRHFGKDVPEAADQLPFREER